MKKWLIVSVTILIIMVVAAVFGARAFMPPPIPEPPTIADAPLAIHINEIDLSTRGIVLISIDNLTKDAITIDVSEFPKIFTGHVRIFDPYRNEYDWSNDRGTVAEPFDTDNSWQWGYRNGEAGVTIEPGRTEDFSLQVRGDTGLMARSWVARFRGAPDRLIYVVDCEMPVLNGGDHSQKEVHLTAKGEAAYQPRP